MKDKLKEYCDLFIANKKTARKTFPLEITPTAGSLICTGKGRTIDSETLKNVNGILKSKEHLFSALRGNMKVPVICMMAMSDNPEEFADRMHSTFDKLNVRRLFTNEYDIVSALVLNQKADDSQIDSYVSKTLSIYDKMKEQHLFQTSGGDMPFAAIIAATDGDIDAIFKDAEECYQLLRKRFPVAGSIQSLSHILAVTEGTSEEKVDKLIALYDAFKAAGIRYGKSFELAALGSLVGLDMSVEEIVKEAKEAYDYINENGGYKFLEASKEEKVMYASIMVLLANSAANSEQMESAALSAQLALALAIELCVIMITTSIIINSSH